MGGMRGEFPHTLSLWSQFLKARTLDETRRQAIVGKLMEAYWKPVYCYLRRKGFDNERAKDLTQGFFCDIVLGRGIFQQADLAKGRFRTFLLTALDRYVIDVHDAEIAGVRLPRGGLVSLDVEESGAWDAAVSAETPEQAFCYGWIAELLDRVLAEVEQQYRQDGHATHWEVFRARVLDPIMAEEKAPPLPEVCAKYGVADPAQASNMIATVKRRFHTVLQRVLRDLSPSDGDAEEEFREILAFLSGYSAR
jgi:DNA-directed RNA polymerase specialized sigma24 family protein